MLTLKLLLATGLIIAQGYACRYDEGEMRRVARKRGYSLVGYQGAVALRDPAWMGKSVWLKLPDGTVYGPLRCVDHLNHLHTPYGADRWAVDVDFVTWRRLFGFRQAPFPDVTVIWHWRSPYIPGWSGITEHH